MTLPDFLPALAASRQEGGAQGPITTLHQRNDGGGGGLLQLTLTCPSPPADSSSAVSQLLLTAFQEATSSGARSKAGQRGLLPRGIEISVVGGTALAGAGPAPSAAGGGEHPQQPQQQGPLRVHFTATEPAAEGEVEEAARLFEASGRRAADSNRHMEWVVVPDCPSCSRLCTSAC